MNKLSNTSIQIKQAAKSETTKKCCAVKCAHELMTDIDIGTKQTQVSKLLPCERFFVSRRADYYDY